MDQDDRTSFALELLYENVLVHPDLLFFQAILLEASFRNRVGRDFTVAIDAIRSDETMWARIEEQGAFVASLPRRLRERRARSAAAMLAGQSVAAMLARQLDPTHRTTTASSRVLSPLDRSLLTAMIRFHRACWGVPSGLRPVLWRYFWEGGSGRISKWVPAWVTPHMCYLPLGEPTETTAWDCAEVAHGLVLFDPRKATRDDLDHVRRDYRCDVSAPKTAGFPIVRMAVRIVAEELHSDLCRWRPEPQHDDLPAPEMPAWSREDVQLQRAWNFFQNEAKVTSPLVLAITQRVKSRMRNPQKAKRGKRDRIVRKYVTDCLDTLLKEARRATQDKEQGPRGDLFWMRPIPTEWLLPAAGGASTQP